VERYKTITKCPKCGKARFIKYPNCIEGDDQFTVVYIPKEIKLKPMGHFTVVDIPKEMELEPMEHRDTLRIECNKCGYMFYESCEDSEGA